MPEHTSFFSYLVAMFPALGTNIQNLGRIGHTALGNEPVGAHQLEPVFASTFVTALILALAILTRSRIESVEAAVIPDSKLTLRAFMEAIIAFFYGMMKDMMGPKRAKRYFPLIGTCALYIFFSNVLGLIPGLAPPTSTWSITIGCAIVVFVAFNYYGIKENGVGYFKHLMGPVLVLAPLIFAIEMVSLCLRPLTLSVRLMLNMAVDHLLVSIVTGMVMLFVPIPILMLSTLVCVVQVMVFCLLSSIYITLATEHEEHDEAHGHAHAAENAHGEAAHA